MSKSSATRLSKSSFQSLPLLSDVDPALLAPGRLPGLWPGDEITVQNVIDYFAGGQSVAVPKEGYEDTAFIPKCVPSVVEAAIAVAVERGIVWLINGPASIFRETVPDGLLSPFAVLNPPPDPVAVPDLMEASIPDAWKDGKANALAIAAALSAQRAKPLPWIAVKSAIDSGIHTRWIEFASGSSSWPCDFANAQHVIIQTAATQGISDDDRYKYGQKRLGTFTAEATLEANGIQDLAEQIPEMTMAAVGHQLRFNIQIELSGDDPPEPSVVEAINSLLAEVSEGLELQ